ncbi:alpha/beta hydrolase [Kineosporia sp. NBRC 101677]|uniref:alpha/beta fold hydrolase n=1 Tax=Kineosporia sp. NBRC 101677 TaxID=3032197 RepID=UPI0024A25661|nr:alpha/beta hydrolase [Kineosporia sp. NBRC 101677]GLY19889.1 alpha/beta hydrolase [Kineosporia sp. NBRC 101677]
MSFPLQFRRTTPGVLLAAFLLVLATVLVGSGQSSQAAALEAAAPAKAAKKPTVVLVHGAFADASGWNDVTSRLQKQGYPVYAWSNPLRGLSTDAAYLRDFLSTIKGKVILVGHSYGGAVITEASTGNKSVESLVYVAAYALAKGENVAAANELGGGHSSVVENIVVRPYPGAPKGDGDAMVKPSKFHDIFAQDLPRSLTKVMGASQRPAALSSLVIPAGEPGWKTIPSYFLVAKNDHLIPTKAQDAMAKRAGATTKRVASSHVLMMTHPKVTADFIVRADRQR